MRKDKLPETIAEARAHNERVAGGSREIPYGGVVVLAPLHDIEQAIADLALLLDRGPVIASINRALARDFPKVKAGTASQKQAMRVMQDVALWFANEVIEGRQPLHAPEGSQS